MLLLCLGDLHYNQNTIGPGAQTSRPDDAGPVRNLRGGMASPAASFYSHTGEQQDIYLFPWVVVGKISLKRQRTGRRFEIDGCGSLAPEACLGG